MRLPNDKTGDCFKFTNALADMARARSVVFLNDRTITHLVTDKGQIFGDAYVVALGSYSPLLLKPLGIQMPVYPVKGYSITAPIIDEAKAPVSTLLDESFKVAITRLGDCIRVGATPIANLFLNTGHGTLGWTMACGSGHVIADADAPACATGEAKLASPDYEVEIIVTAAKAS